MKSLVLLLCLTMSAPALSHPADKKTQCDRVKQQIRDVESRMRAGYTRAQGERLARRLQDLRKKRYRLCR